MEVDLFGNEIVKDELLRDKFIEPPFSILDTKSGNWQKRKRLWIGKGLKSEVGRDAKVINMGTTAIDIRQEQVDSNREQAMDILPIENQPQWYVGDSNELLNDNWNTKFDMVMSCPPYAGLEVYSDLEGDISNKPYKKFLELYESIIAKSCKLLKVGGYACFVVGEVRDKNGFYIGFVPDTIKAFEKCGMKFYNEAILLNAIASASMRANGNMKSQKLVKVHQNILVFKKI